MEGDDFSCTTITPEERELVDIFMGTLQSQYYERILGSVSSGFSDIVIIGEPIGDGLKSIKIERESDSQDNTNKFSNFNSKKKESDTNEVMGSSQAPLTQVPYYPYSYVAVVASEQYPRWEFSTPPLQQHLMIPQQSQYQQQNGYPPRNQPRPRNNYERRSSRVNLMPMSYNQILPYLIHKGCVTPKALPHRVPHIHPTLMRMLDVGIMVVLCGTPLVTAWP